MAVEESKDPNTNQMRISKASRAAKAAPSDTPMSTDSEIPVEAQPEEPKAEVAAGTTPAGPRLRLHDSGAISSYANFANASSTREETVLMFGMIQASDRGQNEIPVQVNDRIVMTPFLARRLSRMLISLLANYEARFGPLGDDAR